jgi:serine/threonine-protein kinase
VVECPGPEEIEGLISGRLPPERQALLEGHLDQCVICRERLETASAVGTIVPEGPVAGGEPPEFPGLRRVMERLGAGPNPGPSAQANAPKVQPPGWYPFLQATDRPEFVGRLGAYEIRREIGRGGMGLVFEGFDPALRRTVAVKVLSPLVPASAEARGRFLREAQSAAALQHDNIVTVHAVDQVNGIPFLVMQHVVGESLADRLEREGRLPFADIVRVGAQVARGLAAAHAKGLVHRDVKPANILLEEGTGRARLADFGLARAVGAEALTATGVVAGTPEFMSPEQATAAAVDARSDLFSLGAVLYAACTGASPFRADSPFVTLQRVRDREAVPLGQVDASLPEWFCTVIHCLLRKDPADRIPSAVELAERLEHSRSAATLTLPGVTLRTAAVGPSPRRFRPWWAAALVGLLLLAALGVAWYLSRPRGGPPEPQRPSPTGFVIAGQPHRYRQLGEAVAAARDGDVIEIHGDGPFPTAPVRTGGKRLTIRAGPRSRPVILAEVPGELQGGPLLRADANLRLDGLDIRWTIEVRPGKSDDDLLSRCVIVSTQGLLTLAHCRVATGRLNAPVGASGQEAILKNCHFVAENGAGVFWRARPASRLSVEGCQFETHSALTVLSVAETPRPAAATALLAANTFASDKGLQLLGDSRPRQPLKITARQNVFDHEQFVQLIWRRIPRVPRPGEMIDLLRSFVQWSEEANLHRRGCQYLVGSTAQRPRVMHSADVKGLAGWLKLWNLPRTQSVARVIRYRERSGASPREPLRLDKVDDPSGPVPQGVGADADRLGPAGARPEGP